MKYKLIFYLIFLIIPFSGCAKNEPTTHCYLNSGLYLIYGDEEISRALTEQERSKWPPSGQVSTVFDFYNTTEKEIFVVRPADIETAREYLIDGYLVTIVYDNDSPSGHHVAPFYGQEYSDIGNDFEEVNIDCLVVSQ